MKHYIFGSNGHDSVHPPPPPPQRKEKKEEKKRKKESNLSNFRCRPRSRVGKMRKWKISDFLIHNKASVFVFKLMKYHTPARLFNRIDTAEFGPMPKKFWFTMAYSYHEVNESRLRSYRGKIGKIVHIRPFTTLPVSRAPEEWVILVRIVHRKL